MLIRINGHDFRDKPKIGVALSGGGVRGIAHIGVLKALNDNNIPIDMIAGTSAGAIVAALYACGYTPRQMIKFAENIDLTKLIDLNVAISDVVKQGMKWFFNGKFRFWSVLPTGLIQGDKLEGYFSKFWQERTVRDTNIPLAITAVDINTATTVFFTTPTEGRRKILNARYYHNVLLTDAVRSSISIPGIFLPKKLRGMTLVDGAVKNNLPTDILHHLGADIIIGVDLGYAGQANYNIKSVAEILLQCIDIMGREVTLLKGEQYADMIIRPDIQDISFQNTKQALLCINRGERSANEKIVEIKKIINSYS